MQARKRSEAAAVLEAREGTNMTIECGVKDGGGNGRKWMKDETKKKKERGGKERCECFSLLALKPKIFRWVD